MDKQKKIIRLENKIKKLREEHNSLNRHDFSGSWADRIKNNTGPQYQRPGQTSDECLWEYNKNVSKKIKAMNTYNRKTLAKIADLEKELKELKQ